MDGNSRNVQIVKMRANHIKEIAALEKVCFSKPWSFGSLTQELSNPLAVFLAALDENGSVAGYAGMHHILDEGFITNIAVHPDFRRRGIAALILREFDRYARENGLALLTLEVRSSNKAAIELYRREGYCEKGLRPGFYECPTEDALIMTKYYLSSMT